MVVAARRFGLYTALDKLWAICQAWISAMTKTDPHRNPQNRLKNWTGTVHWAVDGKPSCGKVATHASYLTPSVATVNCKRCISINGGDVTGYVDPPVVQGHVARRDAERAARRAARTL